LAHLLLSNPDVLLLDEPTNHLDKPTQRWFEQFLLQSGMTLLTISHDTALLEIESGERCPTTRLGGTAVQRDCPCSEVRRSLPVPSQQGQSGSIATEAVGQGQAD